MGCNSSSPQATANGEPKVIEVAEATSGPEAAETEQQEDGQGDIKDTLKPIPVTDTDSGLLSTINTIDSSFLPLTSEEPTPLEPTTSILEPALSTIAPRPSIIEPHELELKPSTSRQISTRSRSDSLKRQSSQPQTRKQSQSDRKLSQISTKSDVRIIEVLMAEDENSMEAYEYKGANKPKFPENCKSLLCKYLTDEVWEKLKDAKDEHGFTFRMAINSGAVNPESSIGVYAGSADTYVAFADLMDKVIEDYHQFKTSDNHVSNMDASKLTGLANLDPEGRIPRTRSGKMIISTRIRVGRNLKEYPLGPGLTKQQRLEVEKAVVDAVTKFEGDLSGTYYSLSSLKAEQKKQLIADHFLFKEGDKYLKSCGLNRDWPSGRGIFHNTEKTFLVWVNEEDQLRIISMQKGADIGEVFGRLSKACTEIEKVAQFSHSEHLGYITSCPTNLGTALRASVHIKLPKLAKDMDKFKEIADKFNVQIRGIHGEHSESEGGVYDISNKRRLGRSEADLVKDMYEGVKAMIEAENAISD